MRSCAVPAHINAFAPSCHLRQWRPLQPLQFTLAELHQGRARNLNYPSFPLYQCYPSQEASNSVFNIVEGNPNQLSCAAGFSNEAATLATPNEQFVSLTEIENAALRQGLELHTDTVGPFFRVRILNLQSKEVLGLARGAVKVWISGRILHLDSIRLSPLSLQSKKPIFGIGLLIGAAAVRYGYDQKCKKAELLAIKDTDVYHSKLVRYYARMGFRTVYDVTGESLQDIPHMLIWGGVGTRMDASIEELLLKWSPAFKKLSK